MRCILSLYGAENGTCPTAVGARVGSDCHRQSFTSDPSSPVSNIKREHAPHTLSLWCGKRDLNPYGVNHTPLKRARLPVPPLPHSLERYIVYYTSHRLSRVNFKKLCKSAKKIGRICRGGFIPIQWHRVPCQERQCFRYGWPCWIFFGGS